MEYLTLIAGGTHRLAANFVGVAIEVDHNTLGVCLFDHHAVAFNGPSLTFRILQQGHGVAVLGCSDCRSQGGIADLTDLGNSSADDPPVAIFHGSFAALDIFRIRFSRILAAGDEAGRSFQGVVDSVAADCVRMSASEGTASNRGVADRSGVVAVDDRHRFAGTRRTVTGGSKGRLRLSTGTGDGGRAGAGDVQRAAADEDTGRTGDRTAGHIDPAGGLIDTRIAASDVAALYIDRYIVASVAVRANAETIRSTDLSSAADGKGRSAKHGHAVINAGDLAAGNARDSSAGDAYSIRVILGGFHHTARHSQ